VEAVSDRLTTGAEKVHYQTYHPEVETSVVEDLAVILVESANNATSRRETVK